MRIDRNIEHSTLKRNVESEKCKIVEPLRGAVLFWIPQQVRNDKGELRRGVFLFGHEWTRISTKERR